MATLFSSPTAEHLIQHGSVVLTPPMSILHDFSTYSPSRDALYTRLLSNFSGRGRSKGERLEALQVSIQLTPAEALRGVVVPIGVPVFTPCVACSGSGCDWVVACATCRGQGMMEREQTVRVRVPPMVQQGSVLEVSLTHVGIENFFLRLQIQITWEARASLWLEER